VYLQIIDGSWVAPARTAALAPAPLSFDDVLSGSPDASGAEDSGPDADPSGAEDEPGEIPGLGAATVAVGAADAATTDDDSSADAAGDGETHDESALADGFPAASFPIPVESGEADALAAGSAFPAAIFPSPANTGDAEADDSASAAASVSATGDRNDSETDASSFPAANLPVADAADSTADHGSTEGDAQPEETTPAARREDDDAPRRRAGAAAALAGGSLPGIAGLAGLANGLRSDDEESDEELPEGLVSPGLAAAFARAGEIEAQMSDIEADIETQEVRAENVDAVAQIETMLEPRGADGATATETVIEVDPFAGEGLDGVDGDGD
jgi:hypothetical protein